MRTVISEVLEDVVNVSTSRSISRIHTAGSGATNAQSADGYHTRGLRPAGDRIEYRKLRVRLGG